MWERTLGPGSIEEMYRPGQTGPPGAVPVRARFSVVVLALDAEESIASCLAGVSDAHDLLVCLDDRTVDGTEAVARSYGARVESVTWTGSFAAQRNRAASLAANDWILFVDSDEEVTPELLSEVDALLLRGPDKPAYSVPRRNRLLGRWMTAGGWRPDRQVRLINRLDCTYAGSIHERVELPEARIGRLNNNLLHRTHSTYGSLLERTDRYSRMEAEEAREGRFRPASLSVVTRPLAHFLRRYVLQLGFRDGREGLIEARVQAYYRYLTLLRIRMGPDAEAGTLGRWLLPRQDPNLQPHDTPFHEPDAPRFVFAMPTDVMAIGLMLLLMLLPFYLPIKQALPGPAGMIWKELLVLGLSLAAAWRLRDQLWSIVRASWLIRLGIAYAVLVFLRALISPHLGVAFQGVQVDVTYLSLALVLLAIPAIERFPVLLLSTLAVGTICALGAITEVLLGRALVPSQSLVQQYGRPEVYISATHILRPYFVFDFPTGLAAYLAVATVIALGLCLGGRLLWPLPLGLLCAVGLMLTFSRGPWLGCLAGIVLIAAFVSTAGPWLRCVAVGGMLALLVSSSLLTGGGGSASNAASRLSSSPEVRAVAGPTRTESFMSSFLHHSDLTIRRHLPTPTPSAKQTFWQIQGIRTQVLGEPPPARGKAVLGYALRVPNDAVLAWGIALDPRVWAQAKGDGVRFGISIMDGGQVTQVFDRYIDPKNVPADRRTFQYRFPLYGYAGDTIRIDLTTNSGPSHDADYDWAAWLNPRVVRLPLTVSLERFPYKSVSTVSWERPLQLPGSYLASVANWQGDASNGERLVAWKRTLTAWKSAPLMGLGPGSVDEAALRANPSTALITESQLLKVLAETGLVGLTIWLAMVVLGVISSIRAYRQERNLEQLIVGAALVAVFVSGIAFQVLEVKQIAALFWVLTGMAVVAELTRSALVIDPAPLAIPLPSMPDIDSWIHPAPRAITASSLQASASSDDLAAESEIMPNDLDSIVPQNGNGFAGNGHKSGAKREPGLGNVSTVVVATEAADVNDRLRDGWHLIATGVAKDGTAFVLGRDDSEDSE